MTLRDDYIAYKQERLDKPFDYRGDMDFMNEHFGPSVSDFCRSVFAQILDMQKRLDQLESDQDE